MIRVQSYEPRGSHSPDQYPAVVLVKDRWNDFGRRALYTAFVFTSATSPRSR